MADSMSPTDKKFLMLKEQERLLTQLKLHLSAPGHRYPRSRREFLSAGLSSIATYAAAPTLMQIFSKSAWAQDISCTSGDTSLPAFINIQLAGGPALFANHLVRGPGGDDSLEYGKLGVGSAPGVETLFSNQAPFWADNGDGRGSPMIKEIKARLGAANQDILSEAAFIAVAAESIDDSLDNPHDISGFMQTAGLEGSLMPYLIAGMSESRFKSSLYDRPNHLFAKTAKSLESSLGFKGSLGQLSSDPAVNLSVQQQLVDLISNLSKKQVGELLADPQHAQYSKLVRCAVEKNSQVVKQQTSVDIYGGEFSGLADIWSLDQSSELNTAVRQAGLAVSTCLRGLSGSATVVLGGYDYHINVVSQRAKADKKDQEAGTFIARTLLSAKLLQKKVFLYISADGSVSSPNDVGAGSSVNWLGDYFKRGMNYIIAYDPGSTVAAKAYSMSGYSDASFQLNHFVSSDGDYVVGNDNPIGNKDSQVLCAAAVFLNYLAFAGKLDILQRPSMKETFDLLQGSIPSGAANFYDYYLRLVA